MTHALRGQNDSQFSGQNFDRRLIPFLVLTKCPVYCLIQEHHHLDATCSRRFFLIKSSKLYFSSQICYFNATTKWSDFYLKIQHFLLIDLTLIQSFSIHSCKTSYWHNPYIGWLKCTRISFQKAYFESHNQKLSAILKKIRKLSKKSIRF